jgi:hypothetical protein
MVSVIGSDRKAPLFPGPCGLHGLLLVIELWQRPIGKMSLNPPDFMSDTALLLGLGKAGRQGTRDL